MMKYYLSTGEKRQLAKNMHYISGSYDVRLREEKVLHQQTLHGGTW
jgi:hypothetical protein